MSVDQPVDGDGRQDVRVDSQIDRCKDGCKDGCKADHRDLSGDGWVRRATVIVLANHKGGVTKTTSTANLGAMLAERGRLVLIVDCDPQANLSETFGWTEEVVGERLEDLLAHPLTGGAYRPPVALIADIRPVPAWRERLRIIACTDALADVAADLPNRVGDGYERRLREVVDAHRTGFDFIFLDTPPGLGSLSGMALLAADWLLIPALAADLDVRGAGKLYDLVEAEVPGLRLLGC